MKKPANYVILILSIVLGLFFIYKGINKNLISPCKVYDASSTIPVAYQNLMTSLCTTGYMKIIGSLEVLCGLLLIFPRTRLLGSIIFMPIILNIFLFHLIIDNRPHELIETGIPLLANIIIFAYYYPRWKNLLWVNNQPKLN